MSNAETILEAVADEFLARYRAGERPSIESFALRHPELSDEIAELLESVALMEQLSSSESEIRELANRKPIPTTLTIKRLGEFDIVREIGRGGMGVVYEATDRSLGRRVALKVLHSSALASEKHVERFRREAKLAAQLHHTNIVSVFGVGEEDGINYYAMQFVDGVTIENILNGLVRLYDTSHDDSPQSECRLGDLQLAASLRSGDFAKERKTHLDVIPYSLRSDASHLLDQRFNDTQDHFASGNVEESSGPSADSESAVVETDGQRGDALVSSRKQLGTLYWQSVARIGVQVAGALQYAHACGILHRDIKPANLLFDSNGTVWVADFGLAKLAELDDITKSGDIVGTLRYMAPEQLSGKADTRTDIYALGLTLYELLTLKPACDGETYKRIFAQKQKQSFAAPRSLNASIPRDLETVVQKMLAPEPANRYASASDVADDLHRFLDDRPIQARRVTTAEHLWRWCRRNPMIAGLAAVSAALMLLLPAVLSWAYVRETAQRQQTQRTLNVALSGFDEIYRAFLDDNPLSSFDVTASEISDEIGDDIGKELESLAPATLTKDTARILEGMLVFYDRLAQENETSADEQLLTASAKARRRVGDLYERLGQFTKAEEAYRSAISRYEQLARNAPNTYSLEIARIHNAIGTIHSQRQDHRQASDSHRLALAILEQNASQGDANTIFETARTNYLLGKREERHGKGRGPESGLRPPPRREEDGFHGRRPPDPPWDQPSPEEIAHSIFNDTAIEQLEELLRRDPKQTDYRFLLALCLREKPDNGVFYENEKSPRQRAVVLLRELATEFPEVLRYRFELSETYRAIDHNRLAVNDETRAIEQLMVARDLSEQLVAEQGQIASYRINLAHIYAYLGIIYGKQHQIKLAEQFSHNALASHRLVAQEFLGLAELSRRLSSGTRRRIAVWLMQQYRWEEVIELLRLPKVNVASQIGDGRSTDSELENTSLKGPPRDLVDFADILIEAYRCLGDRESLDAIADQLDTLDPPSIGDNSSGGPPNQRNGPRGSGPPESGPPRGPIGQGPRFAPPGFGPPPSGGPPPEPFYMESASQFVSVLLTYDENIDGNLTRDELPLRMRREWFARADTDKNDKVVEAELSSLFERY